RSLATPTAAAPTRRRRRGRSPAMRRMLPRRWKEQPHRRPIERPFHSIIPVKLSIIIPVYNEAQTISEVVERVRAVEIGNIEKEIIIANDGSSDGTRAPIAPTPSFPH